MIFIWLLFAATNWIMWSRTLSSRIRSVSLLTFPRVVQFSIKTGDTLPNKELMEGTPGNKVNIKELFSGKKGVLFAVPGAYTPSCSNIHLPGYVKDFDMWKERGFNPIVCVSVNDAFVMSAWGQEQQVGGKIRMLADVDAEFTKDLGMEFDASGILGGIRSKRYSIIVENGVVTSLNVEEDNSKVTCSSSQELLAVV